MAACTADLEYFRCDMCGTYLHMDIFCDHRRACKGKDSKELKKAEAHAISDSIDRASREERARTAGTAVDADRSVVCSGLDAVSKRQEAATRTKVANEWEAEQEAALRKQLADDKMDALLAELGA